MDSYVKLGVGASQRARAATGADAIVLLACMPCGATKAKKSCLPLRDDLRRLGAIFPERRSFFWGPQAPGAGRGRRDREAMAMGSSETCSCKRAYERSKLHALFALLSGPPSSEERSLQGAHGTASSTYVVQGT